MSYAYHSTRTRSSQCGVNPKPYCHMAEVLAYRVRVSEYAQQKCNLRGASGWKLSMALFMLPQMKHRAFFIESLQVVSYGAGPAFRMLTSIAELLQRCFCLVSMLKKCLSTSPQFSDPNNTCSRYHTFCFAMKSRPTVGLTGLTKESLLENKYHHCSGKKCMLRM